MSEPTSCCALPGGYCTRVDTLFNHDGVHVIDVGWRRRDQIDRLCLTVETHPWPVACPRCGVLAVGHGHRLRRLHDAPAFGEPVELVWRARR
jgi:transposase